MWLVFIVFIVILGIIMTEVRINLIRITINNDEINFKVKIDIRFLGFIKIFSIIFVKDYFKIFGIKIYYKKFINQLKIQELKEEMINTRLKQVNKFISLINLRILELNFILRIGLEDVFISSFIVVVFSSIITAFISDKVNIINLKKVNYKILPKYNRNEFNLNGKVILSVQLRKLIFILYKNRKKKKEHNNIKINARKEIKIYE